MTEREQLIHNIIVSEIKFSEWLDEARTATGERAEQLKAHIDRDREVIAKWMADFNITFDEIAQQRKAVLLQKLKEEKRGIDVLENDIKDNIAKLQSDLDQIPQKRVYAETFVNALIATGSAFL